MLSIVRSYYLNSFNLEIFKRIGLIKEEQKPALLQFVSIVDSSCSGCFNINQVADAIKGLDINITKSETLEFSSDRARQLIDQYGIKIVPVLIISGETDNSKIAGLWDQLNTKKNDGVVYFEAFPPYRNLTSGNIEGLVSLITLTYDSCSTCYDPAAHEQVLSRFGIKPTKESVYDVNSTEGNQLLIEYNITKVPTILLSPEARVYTSFVQVWRTVGTVESDGWHVFRATEQMGNYTDLTTGEILSE